MTPVQVSPPTPTWLLQADRHMDKHKDDSIMLMADHTAFSSTIG